ncbi:uncharacterized protein B0H64DRAFT_381306 [Chaetomium fimeti]|uniref:Uncharacterized protein n=1 Tax=Chaetomium fimeti TaxID=1854472 RepID=A0AAE0HRR4_9PEZI|nr:hypothetical protein B0H64DRAFT_381306 [Chaetomium fimeti]
MDRVVLFAPMVCILLHNRKACDMGDYLMPAPVSLTHPGAFSFGADIRRDTTLPFDSRCARGGRGVFTIEKIQHPRYKIVINNKRPMWVSTFPESVL